MYASYMAAFLEQPDHRINFVQLDYDLKYWVPVYGPNGKIGVYNYGTAYYFDGKQWFDCAEGNIFGERAHAIVRNAWFVDGGLFTLDSDEGSAQYIDGKGWQGPGDKGEKTSIHRLKFEIGDHNASSTNPWPAESRSTNEPGAIAKDRFGILWLMRDGSLYRSGYDLCLPVFESNAFLPMAQTFSKGDVLIDRKGNTLVGDRSYLKIPPKSSPPAFEIKSKTTEKDHVVVVMGEQADSGIRYVARFDGGAWGQASKGPELTIGPLPEGQHEIEIFALDPQLQPSPIPERFSVTISRNDEIMDSALKDLQSANLDARKAAVESLVARGKDCLRPLRELRKTADAGLQWWIDAAIEKINEDAKQENRK